MHTAMWTRAILLNLFYSVITTSLGNALKLKSYKSDKERVNIRFCGFTVLSANFKSSTSTMVYVAGFFQLASGTNT